MQAGLVARLKWLPIERCSEQKCGAHYFKYCPVRNPRQFTNPKGRRHSPDCQ
jgi:hypothetical protein